MTRTKIKYILSSSSQPPSLQSPAAQRVRWSQIIRLSFGGAVLLFCAANVYRGATLRPFTSSHDYYFRRDEDDEAYDRRRYRRDDGEVRRAGNDSFRGGVGWRRKSVVKDDKDRVLRIRPVVAGDYPPYNATGADGVVRPVPLWQRRLRAQIANHTAPTVVAMKDRADVDVAYFLVELLQVRIYAADPGRWSFNELRQWMHYLFLAGVEHIYVCDHFVDVSERLDAALQRYVDAGLVTYLPWSTIRNPMLAQTRCYQHIINRFRRRHRWQLAVDIDEYPFAPNDTDENFLVRYLERVPEDVTEISLQNFLMLGAGDRRRPLVVERITRMTPKPANDLVKPVYRPDRVGANVHHNHVLSGRRRDADTGELRMLHYWGGRAQRWGPDTPKILDITRVMTDMRDAWSVPLTSSLLVFGDGDALTNTTGP